MLYRIKDITMKQISSQLAAHIAGEVTTLCTCWKLTRRDGLVMGFCDHDADLVIGSVTYAAATGFTPSAVAGTATLAVDNLEVEGMLSAGAILESDLMAGLYDFAAIDIFMVNYSDLTQGVLKLRRGWLGEVSLSRQHFVAEVRGLAQALQQNIGELFSPSCRASLGDARCKINLTGFTAASTVTSATGQQAFTASGLTGDSGIYALGLVTFTSGANAGLSMEVKEHVYASSTGGTVTLTLALPYTIAPGDAFTIVQGCDKTIGTCFGTFNNVANFRGEPSIPGIDKMLATAGTTRRV